MGANWDDGFCANTPSWHRLETFLENPPANLEEALPLGFPRRDNKPGHWEPIALPVFDIEQSADDIAVIMALEELSGAGTLTEAQVQAIKVATERVGMGRPVEITDWYQIKRDDDPTVRLSVPKNSYSIIGNRTFTEIGMAVVEQGGVIETLFSLGDGQDIGMTIRLDEPLAIAGDDTATYPYVCLTSSHDGDTSLRGGPLAFRVVCANTVALANLTWDDGSMPSFSFKHTAGVEDRVEEAKELMRRTRTAFAQFAVLSEELAKLPTEDEQLADFLTAFVPEPAVKSSITDRQRQNIETTRMRIRSLYEDSVTTEGVRGSALGLVHAAVEYQDHYRAHRTVEGLVRRTLVSDQGIKRDAVKLAFEVHGAEMPVLSMG